MMELPELYIESGLLQKNDNIIALNTHFKTVKLFENCHVMDVGCGPGNITNDLLYPAFPKSLEKLIGTDISEKMINFAKKNYNSNNKLSFSVMNITIEIVPSEYLSAFHHIVSLYCFQIVFNHRKALSNMFAMLKPGGNIFLNFMGNCVIFDIYKSLKEDTCWRTYLEHYETEPPTQSFKNLTSEYEYLLKEIGFETHFCIATKKVNKSSKQLFKNFMLAVKFFDIPKSLEDLYINYFMDFLKRKNLFSVDSLGNEFYYVPYTLLTVYASKPL
ncbi:hypothetical protein FQR65_LT06956 [Abscondita terminalis]|nr:hypothetical protein FQR65_LT06956 [Abscondita terminalis]